MFAPASSSRLGARQGKKKEGLLGLDVCIFYNAICFPKVIQSAEKKPLTGTSFKLDRFGQMCLYLCLCFLLLISFISNPQNMFRSISMYNYTRTHNIRAGTNAQIHPAFFIGLDTHLAGISGRLIGSARRAHPPSSTGLRVSRSFIAWEKRNRLATLDCSYSENIREYSRCLQAVLWQ